MADPNYGLLWGYCKRSVNDSGIAVWKTAKLLVLNELLINQHLYFKQELYSNKKNIQMAICEAGEEYMRCQRLDEWTRIFGYDGINT